MFVSIHGFPLLISLKGVFSPTQKLSTSLMSGYAASCAEEQRLHRTTGWWGYATAIRGCDCPGGWAKHSHGQA